MFYKLLHKWFPISSRFAVEIAFVEEMKHDALVKKVMLMSAAH